MFDCKQFTTYVLRPALEAIGKYSEQAEILLLATMAQESRFGTFLKQVNGPAVGIFQMEPSTYDDLWKTTLRADLRLSTAILMDSRYLSKPIAAEMIYNLRYATQMARVFYLRVIEPLPASQDPKDLFSYYKKYYNTYKGQATIEEFVKNFNQYVRP